MRIPGRRADRVREVYAYGADAPSTGHPPPVRRSGAVHSAEGEAALLPLGTQAADMITILALVGLLSAAPLGTGNADGQWPLAQHQVVEPFAPPLHDWQAGHRGVDLAAVPGATVSAMVAGRVTFAGVVGGKPVVSVELDDGRRVTYEPVRALVAVGQQVATGDVLGLVASAGGHCGGAGCLHLGLRTPTGYANPLGLLARRPAVLRPL